MRYIDSGIRQQDQTVAWWMQQGVESGISEFRCQSGYFTIEGVGILLPSLKECAAQGSRLRLVLGSNGGSTLASHVSFLAGALGIPQLHISIGIVAFQTSLFHPKVYHFTRSDGSQSAYVGSANLTGPGISGLNIEAGIVLDTRDGDDLGHLTAIADHIDRWFDEGSNAVEVVNSATDIEALLTNGRLALAPQRRSEQPGENGQHNGQSTTANLTRLSPIIRLPAVDGLGPRIAASISAEQYGATPTFVERRYTEASFHYPQGTHLGHILAILRYCSGDRAGGPFDDHYVRLNGGFGQGRIAALRRQIKYKLLAAIELGLVADIRVHPSRSDYSLALTDTGRSIWNRLSPQLNLGELDFTLDQEGMFSTAMLKRPSHYNQLLRDIFRSDADTGDLYRGIVLAMPAAAQMFAFLQSAGASEIRKSDIYRGFFDFGPVKDFCDLVGIDPGTTESARHRCPFLINLLDSCDLVDQTSHYVTIR